MLAVIWDMDGVLLDTEPIYLSVESAIVSRYGKNIETVLPQLLGRRALEAATITVNDLALPLTVEAYLEERNAELLKRMPACTTLPGIPDVVAHLRRCGVRNAIATSSPQYLLDAKRTGKADFFALFDAIVCGDDVQNGKPHPDIFLKAAAAIDALPKDCVVFEDAPAGLRAAKAAGMRSVALPNDKVDVDLYTRESPTFVVPSARILDFDLKQLGVPPLPPN